MAEAAPPSCPGAAILPACQQAPRTAVRRKNHLLHRTPCRSGDACELHRIRKGCRERGEKSSPQPDSFRQRGHGCSAGRRAVPAQAIRMAKTAPVAAGSHSPADRIFLRLSGGGGHCRCFHCHTRIHCSSCFHRKIFRAPVKKGFDPTAELSQRLTASDPERHGLSGLFFDFRIYPWGECEIFVFSGGKI